VIEANLFDFSGNLYGEKLKVFFLEKLRDEEKFNTKEELIKQIETDKQNTLKIIKEKKWR
jgi:riboflavin kinase/FMN adenylyltransferase